MAKSPPSAWQSDLAWYHDEAGVENALKQRLSTSTQPKAHATTVEENMQNVIVPLFEITMLPCRRSKGSFVIIDFVSNPICLFMVYTEK